MSDVKCTCCGKQTEENRATSEKIGNPADIPSELETPQGEAPREPPREPEAPREPPREPETPEPPRETPQGEAPQAAPPALGSSARDPPVPLTPLGLRLRADAPKFPENFRPGAKALCVERDGQKVVVYHSEVGGISFDEFERQLTSKFQEEIEAGVTKIIEHQALSACAICTRISYCDVDYERDGYDICVGCWIVEMSEIGFGHIDDKKLWKVSAAIHDLYYELY